MESLIKFKKFIDELNINNSRNYKLSVLEKYRDDEDIKFYLNYVYDPYKVTGISDKKIMFTEGIVDTFISPIFPFELNIKSCLKYVLQNNTGTYEVLNIIGVFKYAIRLNQPENEELKELFNKIVTKNLPLGIDAKSINKAMKEKVIPTFNVMLAEKYFDKPEYVEGKSYAITTKIDGMRCIALKENGKISFWSRQGQEITGLVDLENEMLEKLIDDDICLDGELVAISDNPDTYKQTMKLARTKDTEKHGLKMKVFDIMKASEFKVQQCSDNYSTRRNNLLCIFAQQNATTYISKLGPGPLCEKSFEYKNKLLELINTDFTYFELLPILYEGNDTNKVIELLEEQTSKGEEGIMINICDACYVFDRTRSLLKVKKFLDTEVTIKGFENGINKHSGTLGALICDYKGYDLGVGSGFTDEERDYIWAHQDEYLGKTIKVKYFEETTNDQGGLSLRFPVYLGLRLAEDK